MLYDKKWDRPVVPDVPAPMEKWRTVLLTAAEIVERGWCQRDFHRWTPEGDQFCAIGAIQHASRIEGGGVEAHERLGHVVGCGSIADWNDALPQQGGAQIVAAKMREVARQK